MAKGTVKERFLFEVLDRAGKVVGVTRAVSEKQAVNNMRHRLVGDVYGYQNNYNARLVTDEDGRGLH